MLNSPLILKCNMLNTAAASLCNMNERIKFSSLGKSVKIYLFLDTIARLYSLDIHKADLPVNRAYEFYYFAVTPGPGGLDKIYKLNKGHLWITCVRRDRALPARSILK